MYKKRKTRNSTKSLKYLEEIQKDFGGELVHNKNLLKINSFCFIEQKDEELILNTYIYGTTNQVKGNTAIRQVLKANLV